MRRSGGAVVLVVIGLACSPIKTAHAPADAPAPTPGAETASGTEATWIDVANAEVAQVGAGRRLTLALTRTPEAVGEREMSSPPRLVLDLAGPRPAEPRQVSAFPLADELVSRVRVGSFGGKLRAIVDLSRAPGAHVVRHEGAKVIIDLGDTSLAAAAPARAARKPARAPVAAAPPAAAPPETPGAPEAPDTVLLMVRDVRVEPMGADRRLIIELTRPPDDVRDFALSAPPRLVMDLHGPLPTKPAVLTRFPLTDDVIAGVRVATNGGALRIVADLNRPARSHAVRREGNRLVADLTDTGTAENPPAHLMLFAEFDDAPGAEPEFDGEAAPPPPAAAPPAAERPARVAASEAAPKAKTPPATAQPAAAERAGTEAAAEPEPAPTLEPAPPLPVTLEPAPPLPVTLEPAPPPPAHLAALPHTLPAQAVRRESSFTGQRISLDFKDADIQNVLRVLADVSGLNIIATDDVKGKVTLHLNDVPWDQALDLVLRSNRLEKTQEGNVVRISTVSRLKEEREALRAAQDAERELEPLRVKYIRVNYAKADETLIEKVKGVLTDRGSVTFDDRTNTIIVRDIPHGTDDASQLIHELDVQSPQVLIEANIVEATRDVARALGVQWGYNYQAGPQTGNPTGLNFPGTVGVGGSGLNDGSAPAGANGVARSPVPFLFDFPVGNGFSGFGAGNGSSLDVVLGSLDGVHALAARLTALEQQGKAKVISRPRVITLNNVAATIQSLTILRVKLPSTGTVINTGTGGAAGSASTATEKINTGITLVVTPQVSADGYVLMSIYAKSSQPDFTQGRSVDGIPNEISREANSNVLIKDGETVVLGGIFRNTFDSSETGVPYLRGIPVLGWLFKRLQTTNHYEELLVFITPRVVASGTAALPTADRLWMERR